MRSALEIVDRVKALGAALGLDLLARAGVLTGEAVAMRDAVDQGIVTGDLVNTASRLQSAAQPGTVLIGERTYRSVSGSIACVAVEPLPPGQCGRAAGLVGAAGHQRDGWIQPRLGTRTAVHRASCRDPT